MLKRNRLYYTLTLLSNSIMSGQILSCLSKYVTLFVQDLAMLTLSRSQYETGYLIVAAWLAHSKGDIT